MSVVLPKISKFAQKKNLPCREYEYVIAPEADRTYNTSERERES